MDINRTGPRSPHFEEPAQKAQRTGSRFSNAASQAPEADAIASSGGLTAGVTQADLRDPRKAEETLTRRFGDLVDSAGRELGVTVSDTQRRSLVDFMGGDPIMRGKLLSYLEQIVK